MSKLTGNDFKFYVGSALLPSADAAGITTATLSLCDNVSDIKLNRGSKEADLSTRANKIALSKVTMLDISVDVEFKYDSTDTHMVAIEDAYHGGTLISAAVMDKAIATVGARGVAANWTVTKCDRDEPLDGAATLSVTLKPTELAFKFVVAS